MPKREEEELQRVHIFMFKRDVERINAHYESNLGFSKAIRLILRKFLDNVEAKALANAKHPELTEEVSSEITAKLGE